MESATKVSERTETFIFKNSVIYTGNNIMHREELIPFVGLVWISLLRRITGVCVFPLSE